jgi:hypothetical protein
VIRGEKNLKRYIEILETNWKLSIEEIRRFYFEDKNRVLSKSEVTDFILWYETRTTGLSREELRARAEKALGGVAA